MILNLSVIDYHNVVNEMVKVFLYRLGQALRVPGS